MSEPTGEVLKSRAESGAMARVGDMFELTKPRLTLLSVMTTLAGYYLGARGDVALMPLLHTLLGTFLVGAGCGAVNMFMEGKLDGMMKRTASRPIPSGRVTPFEALVLGLALALGGMVWLTLATNLLAGLLAAATFVSYVFLYTPLKQRSTLNTIVGAIPGALPPIIGWAAAEGNLSIGAVALFALLFFWQMPHFLALAWMCREDYARADYKMLPVLDPDGTATARQILVYTAALLPVSLIPTLVGMSGPIYFFGAVILGGTFLFLGVRFALRPERGRARWVFHFSLAYLPVLLLVMAIDGPRF